MLTEDRLAKSMHERIVAGEMPYDVFDWLHSQNSDIDSQAISSIFRMAFPETDGVVWNIITSHLPRARKSGTWRLRLNGCLIEQLLKAGYSVPWTRQDLETLQNEWESLRAQENADHRKI